MSDLVLKDVYNKILEEDFFSGFKFRKRDSTLIKKSKLGYDAIELQNWREGDKVFLKPLYLKRFNVLHSWFENFSFKNIKDQRDNYSLGFDGGMLGSTSQYTIYSIDKNDDIVAEICKNGEYVFTEFSNLIDVYNFYVAPILAENKSLPGVGADWIFEHLTLARVVSSSNYNQLKNVIRKQVEFMYEKGEPNIVEYYYRYDEIIEFLEANIDLGDIKNGGFS